MFDLMGAIRKKQQAPPPADSAETAESPQPRGLELADNLRETADFSAGEYFSATIRKNPQTLNACKAAIGGGFADLSADPQNPQPPAEQKQQNPDALLLDIAAMLQVNPDQLRALLSIDDIQDIADGANSRAYMLDYFRLMRADGKLPVSTAQPPAKAIESPQGCIESAKAWKPAHEAMMNHVTDCTACRAPQSRYCNEGANLRRAYRDAHQSAASTPGVDKT
jgi:hypothetical protein